MKFLNWMGLSVLGMIACGAAHARTISYDCGGYTPYTSIDPEGAAGLTLSFTPGVETSVTSAPEGTIDDKAACQGFSATGAIAPGGSIATSPLGPQWMEQGNFYENPGLNANWEVVVTDLTGSSNFTVEFLYNNPMLTQSDLGCEQDTATLSLSTGASYAMKNACGGSGDYLFTFNSQGQLVGTSPFPATTTTAAPEIDSTSAVAGMTLLFGLIAVIRGRRELGDKLVSRAGIALR
jgi:hypothetical protein